MQLLTRKFTVEQYYKMAEIGILNEHDRVELIRGEIIEMSPIGSKHAAIVNILNDLFTDKLKTKAIVSIQNTVKLDENSAPQPDVVLLRPRNDFYVAKIPQPEDILLLVEVADRTTKYDREIKIPLYAENNIFEVWLIDVNNKTLEIYRSPDLNRYEQIEQITSNKLFSTLSFPNVTINFDEIFSVLSM